MKHAILLDGPWQMRDAGDRYTYTQAFEVSDDFRDGRVYAEFDGLSGDVGISVDGAEVAVAGNAPIRRLKIGDWVHAGPNEITLRSRDELPNESLSSARLVSYDKVSISRVRIDPDVVDNMVNVWITISIDNHTREEQDVLASIVLAQGECREQVEVVGCVSPFGGEIEAVIRVTDPEMWQPNESGEVPAFHCLMGLQVEGEVMDVAALKFAVD